MASASSRLTRGYPWAAGLAVGGAVGFLSNADDVGVVMPKLLPSMITVAAIFAGFQATIHAYLTSTSTEHVIAEMKKSGPFDRLVAFVRVGLLVNVAFVVFALACQWLMAVAPSFIEGVGQILLGILAGGFTTSLAASYRIMDIQLLILRLPPED